jgi:hypothetical protein
MGGETLKPDKFVVELAIDGMMFKSPCTALNRESMLQHLSILVATNLARVSGYNLYAENGELIASVHAAEFLNQIKPLQANAAVGGTQGGAGWRAVPAKIPTSAEFQDMVEKARKEDRRLRAGPAPE